MSVSRQDEKSFKTKSVILVANEGADSVSLIDPEDFILQATIPVGEHPHEVEVSPNGKFALVSNFGDLDGRHKGRTLAYLDLVKKSLIKVIDLGEDARPHGIAFLSEELALVTAEGRKELLEVNVKNRDVKIIPLHDGDTLGDGGHLVVVDKKQQYAYVSCRKSGTVCRVNLHNRNNIDEINIGDKCEGIMLTSDNKRLLVSSRADNTVSVVDTASFEVVHKIKTARGPLRIAEFDNGKSVAVTNCISGNVQTFSLDTYDLTGKFNTTKGPSRPNGVFFFSKYTSPGYYLPVPLSVVVRDDQQTAYITHLYGGKISLVDLKKQEVLSEFEALKCPDGLSVSKYQVEERSHNVRPR